MGATLYLSDPHLQQLSRGIIGQGLYCSLSCHGGARGEGKGQPQAATMLTAVLPVSRLPSQATGPSGAKMQLLETAFSSSVQELIELHLLRQDSIPAFLSALTLDLFSRQTVA